MIFRPRALPALIFRHRTVLALITGALAFSSGSSFAVDILRSSPGAAVHDSSSTSQSSAASVSQTSTSATAAAAEQAQTAVLAARAQSSLMRATAALHAKQQSELSAQQAAAIASTPSVPSGGLVVHGLVPGTVGIDPADPTTVAIPIPVITNAQGSGFDHFACAGRYRFGLRHHAAGQRQGQHADHGFRNRRRGHDHHRRNDHDPHRRRIHDRHAGQHHQPDEWRHDHFRQRFGRHSHQL